MAASLYLSRRLKNFPFTLREPQGETKDGLTSLNFSVRAEALEAREPFFQELARS
jgi:hypothetical protein